MKVNKYVVTRHFTICDKLFITGDELFIEQKDRNSNSYPKVFYVDKSFIGIVPFSTLDNIKDYLKQIE